MAEISSSNLSPAHLGEEEADEVAGHQLGEEALGRGHGDLGAGVRVEHGVGLARDGRAVGVADREHPGLLVLGVPQRHEGVHGLAGLADDDDQGGAVQDRVAVAELAGQLDLDRDAGPVLDGVLGDQAGVVGGAAGDDEDLVDVAQLLVGEPDLVEHQLAAAAQPAEQGVGDRLRLLGDLLEHEPVVAALLGGSGVPVDPVGLRLGRRAVEAGHGHAAFAVDLDDLVLTELAGLAGVRDEGGDVRAEEVLTVADADHQRAVAPRGDEGVRLVGVRRDQGERAVQPSADDAHRLGEPARPRRERVVRGGEEVRGHLGVGLGGELDAGVLELRAQGGEVLDDPVVDHGDAAVAGHVRVGVAVGRSAVRRPAGVPDAERALRKRPVGQHLLQVGQLAGLLGGAQRRRVAVPGPDGDAGRVVPAVLQPPKSVEDDGQGVLRAHVPHDAAHCTEATGVVAGSPRAEVESALRRRRRRRPRAVWRRRRPAPGWAPRPSRGRAARCPMGAAAPGRRRRAPPRRR